MLERKRIEAVVGLMSLIGVGPQRPCSWGNYFWIGNLRIVNFWAENLTSLVYRGILDDGMVEVACYEHWAIIVDDRIPKEWFYPGFCFTGSSMPPIDVIEEMNKFVGLPDEEMLRFSDPTAYYATKPGHTYNAETGMLSIKVDSEVRPLKASWTVEEGDTE